MTDIEFDAFLDRCYNELEEKQAQLISSYHLGSFQNFWVDETVGTIKFTGDNNNFLEFDIIPIGSWSSKSDSWMWAWANNSIEENLREKAAKIKELLNITGYPVFADGSFKADEHMAHEIAAIAVHHLSALGMYITPHGQLKMFFALTAESRREN